MKYVMGRRIQSLFMMVTLCIPLVLPGLALATGDIGPKGVLVGTSEDGTEFTFGMLNRTAFFTLQDLDFLDAFQFRAFTIADANPGDTQFGIRNLTDLMFKVERGPVSLFSILEIEATVDELAVDVNHINLEQVVASYKLPDDWGTLNVGWGIHIVDVEGALVYGDEAPGIWLQGSKDNYEWNVGYIKRIDGNRGVIAGRLGTAFPGDRSTTVPGRDVDADIWWVRGGYDFKLTGEDHITVAPLFVINRRHTPQALTSVFPCPTLALTAVGAGGDCLQGATGNPTVVDATSQATYYYPGAVVKGKFGPVLVTAEAAGRLGGIDKLPSSTYAISSSNPSGITDFDANTYAFFAEVALDLTTIAPDWAALTPFLSVQFNKGDSDPFDDNLGGWVSISDLNEIVRKDSFNLRSITSVGAMLLGGACEGSFGFNTSGRGTGPTQGTSNEDAAVPSPLFFNNRCGKGDNPGMIRVNVGWVGNVTPEWDSHFVVSPMWFQNTASIEAEAAGSRIARGVDTLGCAGTANCVRATAGTLKVSSFMGTEVNFNVGYNPTTNFRISPFVSVFVPGAGAEDIGRLFVDSAADQTAVLAGIDFIAKF